MLCEGRTGSAGIARRAIATAAMLVGLCMQSGCMTAHALRGNTIQQANTVADIHQQQVLDNLAHFVCDPYAVPSFAFVESGSAQITDQADGGFGLNWNATQFSGTLLRGNGLRGFRDTWVTVPVNDPRKLELMRCAYQRAVASCGRGGESLSCPDCRKRFNEFYTGRAVGSSVQDGARCYACDGGEIANLVPGAVDPPCVCRDCPCSEDNENPESSVDPRCYECEGPNDGSVNSECLNAPCWFCFGCKACVPKDCERVGRYGDTYVWAPKGPGRNELARLTLAILDYAVNESRQLPTKEVTAYLKQDGTQATSATAELVVKTVIVADDPSLAVIQPDLPATMVAEEVPLGPAEIPAKSKNAIGSLDGPSDSKTTIENNQKTQSTGDNIERIRKLPRVRPLPSRRSTRPGGGGLLLLRQQLETID